MMYYFFEIHNPLFLPIYIL